MHNKRTDFSGLNFKFSEIKSKIIGPGLQQVLRFIQELGSKIFSSVLESKVEQ